MHFKSRHPCPSLVLRATACIAVALALGGCLVDTPGPSSHASPIPVPSTTRPAAATYTPHASSVCPGHWHAQMQVVLDGHVVNFTDPHFYLEGPSEGVPNGMPVASHMHRAAPGEWHFEPNPTRCLALGSVLQYVGMSLTQDEVVLTGAHQQIPLAGTDRMQAGTYTADDSHVVRAFTQHVDQAWREVAIANLTALQLFDGAKLLVVYGEPGGGVAAYENAVPAPVDFAAAYQATHHEPPDYPEA